jgi:inward rectifier potassium channel
VSQHRSRPRTKPKSADIGFGTQALSDHQRLIRQNGRFNVQRKAANPFHAYNVYTWLIRIGWWQFTSLVVGWYLAVNTLFAVFYWLIGVENLTGIDRSNVLESFMDAFFFSAQTLTTVGYGRIAPVHIPASTVAAIESMVGLMGFALVTGLLYGRFSRPLPNLAFSKRMLVAPYNGGRALMFRLANKSQNQLIEAEVSMALAYREPDAQGKMMTQYRGLPLELRTVQFMPLSWTLVHAITPESPVYGWTQDDFALRNVEIIVSFKATDDTFMQTLHDRTSYLFEEIVWGAKFIRVFDPQPDGSTVLHLDRIDEHEPVALPELEPA